MIFTYIPGNSKEKNATAVENPPRFALRGLTLRRILGIEPKQRVQCRVYIEKDFLDEMHRQKSRPDLNTEINLALEHYLTTDPEPTAALAGSSKEH